MIQKQNYYEVDALSFSFLSKLSTHPKTVEKGISKKKYFSIGGCVDLLLTDYNSFNETYYVNNLEPLTGQVLTLYEEIEKKIKNENLTFEQIYNNYDLFFKIIEEFKLFGNTKDVDKIKSKFDNDNFWKSIELLFQNKEVIQNNDYVLSLRIYNSLIENKFTKEYSFINKKNKHLEILDQYEIYWKFLNQNIKSKLDRLIINHKEKTIQPLDFKTTYDYTSMFNKSYYKHKYYYQASLYQTAVLYNISKEILPNYKVLPFKFIVETTNLDAIGQPMIFTVPDSHIEIACFGGKLGKNDYTIRGWKELIEDKIWYDENGYNYPKEYIENKAEIMLE